MRKMADSTNFLELLKFKGTGRHPENVISEVSSICEERCIVAFLSVDHVLWLRHLGNGAHRAMEGITSFLWLDGVKPNEMVMIDVKNNVRIVKVDTGADNHIYVEDIALFQNETLFDSFNAAGIVAEGSVNLLNYISNENLVLTCHVGAEGFRLVLNEKTNAVLTEKIFSLGLPSQLHVLQPERQFLVTIDAGGEVLLVNTTNGNVMPQSKLIQDCISSHDGICKQPLLISATKSFSHVIIVYADNAMTIVSGADKHTITGTDKWRQHHRRKQNTITGFKRTNSNRQQRNCDSFETLDALRNSGNVLPKNVLCSSDKVYLTCRNVQSGSEILYVVDVNTKEITSCRLPQNSCLVFHKNSAYTPLVLSGESLQTLCVGLSQEILVYKLMVYENATKADSLCHNNQWDRCTIPLHALEIGLKHRQLDTVKFFLKSRENDFTIPASTNADPSNIANNLSKTDQLDASFSLLFKSINDHLKDPQSKSFAEQLMHITLDHLHKVLKNFVSQLKGHETGKEDHSQMDGTQREILLKVTQYIDTIYQLLQANKPLKIKSKDKHISSPKKQNSTDTVDNAWLPDCLTGDWEKDVICEGVSSGRLPQVQAYLREKAGPHAANLQHIISTGLQHAHDLIKVEKIHDAERIFWNLGFDSVHRIRQLCLFTPDRTFREYLIAKLTRRNELSEKELLMITFLREVESLYSCPSFELAAELRKDEISRAPEFNDWEAKMNLHDCCDKTGHEDSIIIQTHCGDIATCDNVNSETASHSHLLLAWIAHFTEKHQIGVFLDQILRRKDHVSRDLGPTRLIWEYLCSYLDLKKLLRWCSHQFRVPTDTNLIDGRWPFNQAIDDTMLSHAFENLPDVLRDQLFDELARRGIFSPLEYKSMPILVRRLTRVQALIQNPHVLTLRADTHPVTMMCLHQYLIQHFIDQELPAFLFYYITFWGIGEGELDLGEVGMAQADLPSWVIMMLNFRQTALQPHNLEKVYKTSLSTEEFLQGRGGTVMDMVDRGLLGRSLATLMYAPDQLREFIKNAKGIVLKDALPRLYSALFENQGQCLNQSQDISVYQVLQENCPFDISNLFGWQTTNTLSSEENLKDLPHFSQEELVSRYAHVEDLDYTYYLKHGRPSFALCALLLSQSKFSVKTLSPKSIKEACTKSYWMSLTNFNKTHIVAGCMAFIEMLGEDSTSQKLHCHVANQIYAHNRHLLTKTTTASDHIDGRLEREVCDTMQKCVYSGRKAATKNVLLLLEESVRWEIEKRRLNSTSFEALHWWLLPMVFCKHHDLEMSDTFLVQCALTDDWVMFLVFAHMMKVPREQLLDKLSLFKKKSLQEHLTYIVTNLVTTEKISTELADVIPNPLNDSVMSIIIKCSRTKCSWRSLCCAAVNARHPFLAIMASNYQNHDALTCMAAWLIASIPTPSYKGFVEGWTSAKGSECNYSSELFTELISKLIADNRATMILECFKTFKPMNLVVPALELYLGVCNGNPEDTWKKQASEFKAEFFKARSKPDIQGCDSVEWVENLLEMVTKYFLSTCDNNAKTSDFLRALDVTNVTRLFSNTELNISKMHQIHLIVRDLDIKINYLILGNDSHPKHTEECLRIAEELRIKRHLHQTRLFADIVQLEDFDITVHQLKNEQEKLVASGVWKQEETRKCFWNKCQTSFTKFNVNRYIAIDYFENQIEECASHSERGTVYEKIYGWLLASDVRRKHIFVKIWKSRIDDFLENQCKTSNGHTEPKRKRVLDKSAIISWKPVSGETMSSVALEKHEKEALDHLVGELLDKGLITEAEEAACHFGHYSKDLTIITTCLNLLHGMPMDNMSVHVKKLLACPIGPRKRTTSTASLVSLPGARTVMRNVNTLAVLQINSDSDDDPEFERVQSLLSTLMTLCDMCTHSKQCAEFIVNAFRIATTLHRSFEWVLELHSLQLLQHMICCDSGQKFELVRIYIESCGLSDDEIAGFIADIILEALQVHVGLQQSDSVGRKSQVMKIKDKSNGGNGYSELSELIQVCGKQTSLGQRLLNVVISLETSKQETSTQLLTMEVELLICAHDCFTVGCHMEGVSSVLRMARIVTENLNLAEGYSLMIRLLTRMGRYSEMTYVFDILREHQQFELLFNKAIDKNHALRSAILDYLKVYHPSDTDMHTMVSLHFTLYREIANILEEAARKQLAIFADMTIENSSPIQNILQNGLQYYSDAGDAYVKENCIGHAQTCVKMARLIALQLQLLSNKVKLIGLDDDGAKSFLRTHKKFYETFIVCDAYGLNSGWSEALLVHVIKGGDMKYLDDMKTHIVMTDSLLSDTVQWFLKDKLGSSKSASRNMRQVLSLCQDTQVRYRLAISLGFNDIVRELLDGDGGVYLKDTMPLKR